MAMGVPWTMEVGKQLNDESVSLGTQQWSFDEGTKSWGWGALGQSPEVPTVC